MYFSVNNKITIKQQKDRKMIFLGYKKTEALSELKSNLTYSILDKSIFWSCVLDLSGLYKEVLDYISDFFSQKINIAHPKFAILLWQSYEKFNSFPKSNKTYNCQELRNSLSLLVSGAVFSPKNDLPKLEKFPKDYNFNLGDVRYRIKRNEVDTINYLIVPSDPKIIWIPLNEIDYALSNKGDNWFLCKHAIFWLSWLLRIEKNQELQINKKVDGIDPKFQNDITWYIWEIIHKYTANKNPIIKRIINCLFNLYKNNFSKSKKKKKINYIIHSFLLIIDKIPPIPIDLDLFIKSREMIIVNLNINYIYQNISEMQKKDSNNKDKIKLFLPMLK